MEGRTSVAFTPAVRDLPGMGKLRGDPPGEETGFGMAPDRLVAPLNLTSSAT